MCYLYEISRFLSYFNKEIVKFRFETTAFSIYFLVPSSSPDTNTLLTQRLEKHALRWQDLHHPNVSEFLGLAYDFGYMPALILPFYGNGNVVGYVKEKNDETKLDMVLVFVSLNCNTLDKTIIIQVKQIAKGLDYLHIQSIIHGDLRGVSATIWSSFRIL